MSRSPSRRSARRPRAPERLDTTFVPPEREGGLFALLKLTVAALIAARLLVAPEGAVFGDSLWIVALWFVAGVVWAWDAWRRADGRVLFDAVDVAVWALAGGHVVSALWTFHIGGDRRAALNLAWEWVALGTSFFLLRQVLRRCADPGGLLVATLALVVSLAGLGIWQHYVWLPDVRQKYTATVNELHELRQAPSNLSADEARKRHDRLLELQQILVEMEVPAQERGRLLFEGRLHSSEPFGLFALANTFAAVLLAWLVVEGAMAARLWHRPGSRAAAAGFTLALLPLAYCLLLTKSRTAWTGLAAAGATWLWLEVRRARRSSETADREQVGAAAGAPRRRPWVAAAAAVVLLGGAMVFVATLSGGFDRQVVSEAPKSLSYRVQYWIGAARVVREHPVFGVGPGNFRQHYLQHMLPQSSEEIAEPHNFVLDLWTSGGFLAVAAMAALIVVGARSIRRAWAGSSRRDDAAPTAARADGASLASSPLVWGTGLAMLIVISGRAALGILSDERLEWLLWLGGGCVVAVGLAATALRSRDVPLPVTGVAAAALGVLVHLLGSGGIEMPAVPQMLLLLVALASGSWADEGRAGVRDSLPKVILIGAAMAVLFAACWITAAGPVFQREALLTAGRTATNPEQARRKFAEAAERDPLSPEPARHLAEYTLQRWDARGGLDAADFERGVALYDVVIEADPHNWIGYERLGSWSRARYERSGDPAAAVRAAEALGKALQRYPTNARLAGELAAALKAAGQAESARRHAVRALELDEINRREGHRDKYLPEEQRTELRRIAGQ